MKSNIPEKKSKTSNIKIVKSVTKKYKDTNLFSDKLKWAKNHFKNRDLFKEIDEIEKQEKKQVAIIECSILTELLEKNKE